MSGMRSARSKRSTDALDTSVPGALDSVSAPQPMMTAGRTADDERGLQPVSFDLYLWATPSPVTADQAGDICDRLAEGDQSATTPSPRLLEFASELVARYPRLEDLASPDDSPWSMSPT